MPDFSELTTADWLARIIWGLSALAAWGALWLSWQHHRWLKSQRKTKIKAHATLKSISLNAQGKRDLRHESVTITIYNYGRAVEIESYLLLPWHLKTGQFPFYNRLRDAKTRRLENNHSYQFHIGCHHFRAISYPSKWRRLRISLADGKTIRLRVKGLKKIGRELSALPKQDIHLTDHADYSGCQQFPRLPNFIYRLRNR